MTRVAIIGFGGIAQAAHMPGYLRLEQEGKIKLVAVCDVDASRFESKLEINIGGGEAGLSEDVHKYTDWKEMAEKEEFDMVDICVPTYLHADIAIEMLNRGYDVLSEKPMSLNYENCLRMCEAANKNGKKLMIGQCIRFSNQYNFVKDCVEKGTFGKLVTGVFRRLSPPPVWGFENWFMDYERSHGAILDLHIHDIDFIRHMLGEPQAVSCNTMDVYSGRDIAHSTLYYPDCSILAIGDWSRQGIPFVADFQVSFEKATVTLADGKLTVYPREGEAYTPDMELKDIYQTEIEYFVNMLETGAENTVNTPESAAMSVKLINTLCDSADKGGEKVAFC